MCATTSPIPAPYPSHLQLYMQLVHDGNKPAGDSYFNSSYTGPTLYTAAEKYRS
jgi:YidC/Oxa1 family membrane protein insertase